MLAQNGDAGSAAAQTALPESDEAHFKVRYWFDDAIRLLPRLTEHD
jgi:hypothetical protein